MTEALLKLADSLEQGFLIEEHSDGSETRQIHEEAAQAGAVIRELVEALVHIRRGPLLPPDVKVAPYVFDLMDIAKQALARAKELAGDE